MSNQTIKLLDQKITRKDYKKVVNSVVTDLTESKEISLDLSGINTMTTRELSELIFYMNYAKEQGVKLLLIYVSKILKHFFELTRTDNFFIIRPT